MYAREDAAALRVTPEGIALWREHEERIALAKRLSTSKGFVENVVLPTIEMVFKAMAEDLEVLRHFYGVTYDPYRKELVTVKPELAPRSRREAMVMQYTRYCVERSSYLWVSLRAGRILTERHELDVEDFLRKAYLTWFEQAPAYAGSFALGCEQPDMKQWAWLELSNWLAANPLLYTETRRALSGEGVSLFDALPPAAILAFDDWRQQPHEPLRRGHNRTNLVSRAEQHLALRIEKRRADIDDLDQFEDANGEEGTSLADRDLAEFFRRESAALSQQEREFFVLAASGMSNKEIAHNRERSEAHVAQVLFRVRRKLRSAAGL